MVHKTHRKLKSEQHKPSKNLGWSQVIRKGKQFPHVTPVCVSHVSTNPVISLYSLMVTLWKMGRDCSDDNYGKGDGIVVMTL